LAEGTAATPAHRTKAEFTDESELKFEEKIEDLTDGAMLVKREVERAEERNPCK